MLVGSFASTFHGEPRTTQDVDLVIEATADQLDAFLAALPPSDWYADAESARDALRRRSMFNVIDLETGWKVDVIVRKQSAFALSEFGRRTEVHLLGSRVFVATAEDTVISKLCWARAAGGSERQLRDVAAVLAATGASLDREYVERWVAELGVEDLWRRVAGA